MHLRIVYCLAKAVCCRKSDKQEHHQNLAPRSNFHGSSSDRDLHLGNLHLSPAAVSLQLQKLSAELRLDLFVRSGKRLAPTPAALRLAEHARAVINQVRDIREEFKNDPGADTRPFHLATGATTLIYRL